MAEMEPKHKVSWRRHEMETFSTLLAFCAGNSSVTGAFPAQRPVMRTFYTFFDLRLNQQLSKPLGRWWFETLPRALWRHDNVAWDKSEETIKWLFLCILFSKRPKE